jgi:DNAJ protein RME-8 N-terminal
VLTGMSLLERRSDTYEVAERRPLGSLAAIVRFNQEPTWLGLEWCDGAPASTYVTASRDALLVAILDTAQVPAIAFPAGGSGSCFLLFVSLPGCVCLCEESWLCDI